MSIKSAQAKQQLRNSDGTFANENKNAGLPSNDMIQRAKSLLDSKSKTEENVLTSSFLPMSARVGLCERYLAGEVEDTDGTLEYLTNQAKTIEERNDGSQALTDTWVDILPRMNAGDSRISRFGFLFATTKQERRGR